MTDAEYTDAEYTDAEYTAADYTVGWISIIATEVAASKGFFDKQHQQIITEEKDNNAYVLGSMGTHNVVMAAPGEGRMGTTPAASVIGDMVRSFPNLRFILLVGIAGGAPTVKDIRLGDVVVGIPKGSEGGVRQYDFGTSTQDAEFKQRGHLNAPHEKILTAVKRLRATHLPDGNNLEDRIAKTIAGFKRKKMFSRPATDVLYEPSYMHPRANENSSNSCSGCSNNHIVPRKPRDQDEEDLITIHYGVIASGNRKIEDAIFRDKHAKETGILCFEMEAAGVVNRYNCLVVRGISDYSDSHINKEWQGFAAMAAAAYARALLDDIPSHDIEFGKRQSEVLEAGQCVHSEAKFLEYYPGKLLPQLGASLNGDKDASVSCINS
ncbi:hypothetical protein MCOR25_007722 [Pyricularia grisea]|nr:hypothetical protein MCOR25_007722 [Pyricularia grisea]